MDYTIIGDSKEILWTEKLHFGSGNVEGKGANSTESTLNISYLPLDCSRTFYFCRGVYAMNSVNWWRFDVVNKVREDWGDRDRSSGIQN